VATEPKPAESPRILIVDDDPSQRSLLNSFLRSQGFDTVTADSGERALETLRTGKFGMMISDVRMPGLSGLETLRLARARAARQNHGMPLILGNGNTPWQSHASTLALEPSGRLLLRYINPAGPRAKRDTQQQITTKMDITNKNYILLE